MIQQSRLVILSTIIEELRFSNVKSFVRDCQTNTNKMNFISLYVQSSLNAQKKKCFHLLLFIELNFHIMIFFLPNFFCTSSPSGIPQKCMVVEIDSKTSFFYLQSNPMNRSCLSVCMYVFMIPFALVSHLNFKQVIF